MNSVEGKLLVPRIIAGLAALLGLVIAGPVYGAIRYHVLKSFGTETNMKPGRYLQFFWILLLCLDAQHGFAVTRYVNIGNNAPAPPFLTWATAATNIQDAIDLAADGDEVIVANGVYAVGGKVGPLAGTTNRVTVSKPILVRSLNGPAATTIEGYQVPGTKKGKEAVRCVYLSDGAVLSGFTLTNGATDDWIPADFGNGGGSWCESTNALLTNCVIVENYAAVVGGGVFRGTLKNCTVKGNSSEWHGGGVYGGFLQQCQVLANAAHWDSGGGAAASVLHGCVLTDNTAGSHGGGASGSVLNNCTITGNSVSGFSAAQRLDDGLTGYGGGVSASVMNNCIVFYNRAQHEANYAVDPGIFDGELNYCFTTPLPPQGIGNSADEPLLASASHLSLRSPCRNAGSANFASGLDFDGEVWGNPPSVGADQLHPGTITGSLNVAISVAWTNVAPGFELDLRAFIEGRTIASRWDFGDGTIVSNRPFASHHWSAAGVYLVTLTAFNESHPMGVGASIVMSVSDSKHYVNRAGTNPVVPYATWDTAATRIQDAIDVAPTGGEVVVTNGVYETGGHTVHAALTNRVTATRPITVRSVNGAAVTHIRGNRDPDSTNGLGPMAVRGVYLANGARLIGFTVTNGATLNDCCELDHTLGGGVYCESDAAVLEDCVLVGNRALAGGGIYRGNLYGSTLLMNVVVYEGGGALQSTLNQCEISFNAGQEGGGASASTLSACLVATNTAVWGGGLTYSKVIGESSIIGNQASDSGGGAAASELAGCRIKMNVAGAGGGVFQSRVEGSIVEGNLAAGDGAGALESDLRQSILRDNTAGDDGGGAAYSTLVNCLLTGNSADGGGGAERCTLVHCTVSGNLALSVGGGTEQCDSTNCIVYDNSAPAGSNYPTDIRAGWFSYSCTSPLPFWGIGNITGPPLFVNALGNDYRLSFRSPCIDAGTNLSLEVSNDFAGHARPLDGNGDGVAAFDMGAHENPTPLFLGPGDVLGDFEFPTELVVLSNGVYTLGNNTELLELSGGVRVESMNGPEVTILDAGGTRTGVFMEDAVLSGVTIRNGRNTNQAPYGFGGGIAASAASEIVNCVIANNVSNTRGGGVSGGTLFDCTISNNFAGEGGGVFQSRLQNSVVAGNQAAGDGAGAFGSFLRGCIVRDNAAGDDGGGAAFSTLIDCLLVGNSADAGGGAERSTLLHCTVTANSAGAGGGTDECVATNCIVYFNSAANGANHLLSSMSYSCTTPLPTNGMSNITNSPAFVNAATRDYQLQPGSPCIDAGTSLTALTQTDINGLPRPLDGNRDGLAGFDIGAFEFNPLFFTSIARVDNIARLEWFDTLPEMKLQTTASLENPLWIDVPMPPGTNRIELPITSKDTFFRLALPH